MHEKQRTQIQLYTQMILLIRGNFQSLITIIRETCTNKQTRTNIDNNNENIADTHIHRVRLPLKRVNYSTVQWIRWI